MVQRSTVDREDVAWRCGGKTCRKEMTAKTGTWFQGGEQPIKPALPEKVLQVCAKEWYSSIFGRFAAETFLIRVGNADAVAVQTMRKSMLFLIGQPFYG
uniref:Uncharacterized protein n=1 Tax=Trichuris muris TaxID=70415 RepID=A0A5S6Q818_TRIMR